MYVSPTCGKMPAGAKQGQRDVLATIDDANLRIYVVRALKNGGRQQDVGRVTQIVTDPRAAQYWDEHRVLTDAEWPLRRDLHLVRTAGALGRRSTSETGLSGGRARPRIQSPLSAIRRAALRGQDTGDAHREEQVAHRAPSRRHTKEPPRGEQPKCPRLRSPRPASDNDRRGAAPDPGLLASAFTTSGSDSRRTSQELHAEDTLAERSWRPGRGAPTGGHTWQNHLISS